MTQTIIFIGPQGSGKGTQVEALISHLKASKPDTPVLNIQTGKPFRELAQKGGYTADVVKGFIENGKLVPTVLTNSFVMQELVEGMSADTVLIFDGFPRDVVQAGTLDEMLTVYNRNEILVIFLDTPDEVVKKRMLARGRSDDTEAAIAERLRLYHQMTEPVLAFYRERPKTAVHVINGAQTPDNVASEIQAIVANAKV